MSNNYHLTTINMTNFFNRELFMYSLGDIKFKKPVSLKKVGYTTVFLIIWTLPIVLIFGIHLNIFFASFALAPPIALGYYGSKPLFAGRSLLDFTKVSINYMREPKGWNDLYATNSFDDEYFVESEIWISRRRELQELAQMDGGQ